MRDLGLLLRHRSLLQCLDGQADEAGESSLAILAAGRSIGEEQTLISQLVRMSLQQQTLRSFEQCLALGYLSDEMLANAQPAAGRRGHGACFATALQGERAGVHELMNNVEAGKANLDAVVGKGKAPSILPQWWGGTKLDHAFLLRYYTEAVEATKWPPREMGVKLRDLELNFNKQASTVSKAWFRP